MYSFSFVFYHIIFMYTMPISKKDAINIIPSITNISISKLIRDMKFVTLLKLNNIVWLEHLIKGKTSYSLEYSKTIKNKKNIPTNVVDIIPAYTADNFLSLFPLYLNANSNSYMFKISYNTGNNYYYCGYFNAEYIKESLIFSYDTIKINALSYLLYSMHTKNYIY